MELRGRSRSRPDRWLALAATVSLVLAACAGGGTPTSTPAGATAGATGTPGATGGGATAGTSPATSAGAETAVTFITDFLLWGWHSPYFAGDAEGLFADEGLDVTIQGGQGSVNTATQLATGTVDFGLIDVSTALKAMSEGANFKLIGVHLERYPGGFLFIEERNSIADWPDFEGLTIGGSPNDAYFTALPGLMEQNGADPDLYTLVEMEPAATTGALVADTVDAIPGSAMTAPPRRAAAAEEDLTLGRFGFADHGFDAVGFAIATTTDHYDNDKELVQRFVNAWAASMLWALDNRDAAVDHFVAANPEKNRDLERESLEAGAELTPLEGSYFTFDPERMDYTIDFVNETYGTTFDGSDSYTNEFVDALPDGYTEGESGG
jgi:NitT/TauT family transport system substrate-binding protein